MKNYLIKFISLFFVFVFFVLGSFYFKIIETRYLGYLFLFLILVFMILSRFNLIDFKIMGAKRGFVDFNFVHLKGEEVLFKTDFVSLIYINKILGRFNSHNAVIITNFRFLISKNYFFKQSFSNPISLYYNRGVYFKTLDETKVLIERIKFLNNSFKVFTNEGGIYEFVTHNNIELRNFVKKKFKHIKK